MVVAMTTTREADVPETTTGDDDPCDLPAHELARRLRGGRLSAREALERHLERIERDNGVLNAVVSLDADRARRQAGEADAGLARGEVRGPLHGVPMTLKDAHDVAGLRTTVGTPVLDRIADEDGTVAARLRAAGAIIVGHTNAAAWLGDPGQTSNPVFGRTVNPWDGGRTPGGSSGGAAAALAAGLTPLEIGSDLAGSVRMPAHCCGVYGLKTTEHRVPLTGFFRPPGGAPRPVRILSTLGPMARDLDDLALALSVVAGPDGRDGDVPPVPLGAPAPRAVRDLRLAVAPAPAGAAVARAIRAPVERVAAGAADAGASVVERLPELDWAAHDGLFADLSGAITGVFDPAASLREEQRTLGWYLAALERRDAVAAAWDAFFRDVDALVLPPAPVTAFTHREPGAPVEVDGAAVGYWELPRLLTPANLAGLPALVVPGGLDEAGLPVGVQLVGPRWSEMDLLDVARALEAAGILPGFRRPPTG
jgi:amidase